MGETSITVSSETLKEVNGIKGLIGYIKGKKLTLNDAVSEMCKICEKALLEGMKAKGGK